MSNDLDRLMAERCMGWELRSLYWEEKKTDRIEFYELDWHPSQDIAQAMMCLEKLDPRSWAIESCNVWKPRFRVIIESLLPYGHADTPALAICKAIAAALKEQPSLS